MSLKTGGIWINYEYKKEYQDSLLRGLRARYSKELGEELIKKIKNFLTFLRKKYYFPLRCNMYFCNVDNFTSLDGNGKTKGIFLFGDDETKKTPSIYIACNVSNYWKIEDIYHSIAKVLTYYFQWYFLEDNHRSNRSLEIEATKYANYLVGEFVNKK